MTTDFQKERRPSSRQVKRSDDAKFVVESAALLVERTKTSSNNPLVHIIWLMDGVDLWHRSEGKFGHTIEDARRYMASQLVRLPSERLPERSERKLAQTAQLNKKRGK